MRRVKRSKILASIVTFFSFAFSFFTFDKFAFVLAIPIFVITSVWIIDDVSKNATGGVKTLKWLTGIILVVVVILSLYLTCMCKFTEFKEYKTTPVSLVYFEETSSSNDNYEKIASNDEVEQTTKKNQNRKFLADRYIFSPKSNTILYTEDIKGFSYIWFAFIFVVCELLLLLFDILVDAFTRFPLVYEKSDIDQKKALKESIRTARSQEKNEKKSKNKEV